MLRGGQIGFGIQALAFLEPGIRNSKEIWDWDCIYGRDAGFNVLTKRDLGNRHCEAPRSGISVGEKFKINSTFAFGNDVACERRRMSGGRFSSPKNDRRKYVCVRKLATTERTGNLS